MFLILIVTSTSFFSLLDDGNSIDMYLLDHIQGRVGKAVKDKVRKKEIQEEFKLIDEAVKVHDKEQKESQKKLKEMEVDPATTIDQFIEFHNQRHEEQSELQAYLINQRLMIQEKITDDEWQLIFPQEDSGEIESEIINQLNLSSKEDHHWMDMQEEVTQTTMLDLNGRRKVRDAYSILEMEYDAIAVSLELVQTKELEFLKSRMLTLEDCHRIQSEMNDLQSSLMDSYMKCLTVLKENTSDSEWVGIMTKMEEY